MINLGPSLSGYATISSWRCLSFFLEDLAAFIFREGVTYSEEGSSEFLRNIGVVGVCDLCG